MYAWDIWKNSRWLSKAWFWWACSPFSIWIDWIRWDETFYDRSKLNCLGGTVCRPGLFDNDQVKVNTVGRIIPAPGYGIRIRDTDTGEIIKETGESAIGEIEILSPTRIRGYKGQPTIDWMPMGDLGYLDHDGLLYIKGRIKDEITLYNTTKVNAANIEDKIRNEHFCSEIAVSYER